MNAPHHASTAASAVTVTLTLVSVGLLAWAAVETYRWVRRPRRWPRPRKSWLRDFRAEARGRERR